VEQAWQLLYHDLFDPESGGREAEGEGLLDGLALLWRKETFEGILEDGTRSFSAFSLHWPDGRADVLLGRDNPGLLRIRRWAAADDAVLQDVAAAHLRLIGRRDVAADILACADRCPDAEAFAAELRRMGDEHR
jgi:hypothetical protein